MKTVKITGLQYSKLLGQDGSLDRKISPALRIRETDSVLGIFPGKDKDDKHPDSCDIGIADTLTKLDYPAFFLVRNCPFPLEGSVKLSLPGTRIYLQRDIEIVYVFDKPPRWHVTFKPLQDWTFICTYAGAGDVNIDYIKGYNIREAILAFYGCSDPELADVRRSKDCLLFCVVPGKIQDALEFTGADGPLTYGDLDTVLEQLP